MSEFDGVESVDMCDGCGDIKKIVFVSEFGSVFCKECIDRNKQNLEG
jgi:hypothetical protein